MSNSNFVKLSFTANLQLFALLKIDQNVDKPKCIVFSAAMRYCFICKITCKNGLSTKSLIKMDKKWANFFYVKLSFLVVLIECIYIYHQQLTESKNIAPGTGPSTQVILIGISVLLIQLHSYIAH